MIVFRLLFQTVFLAMGQIWANKAKAVLTTLGIVIGVGLAKKLRVGLGRKVVYTLTDKNGEIVQEAAEELRPVRGAPVATVEVEADDLQKARLEGGDGLAHTPWRQASTSRSWSGSARRTTGPRPLRGGSRRWQRQRSRCRMRT